MTGKPGYFEAAPLPIYISASVLGGLLLCWPMFVHGGPLLFFDSTAYLSGGEKIFAFIAALFHSAGSQGGAELTEPVTPGGEAVGLSIRSIFYSFYVYLMSRTALGHCGPVIVQAILVTALLLLLVPAQPFARRWLAGITVLLLLTPLPFYASLLMPDLLAAAVIIAGLIIMRATSGRALFMAGLVLTGAVSSHYGNLPLAVILMGSVCVWLLINRQLTTARIAAMALPLIIATAVNMLGSAIAFEKASVAPRRLPILLARSLEDGPARWHLAEHCEDYDYAICTALPQIPGNVGATLWLKGGLADIRSPEVMAQIRAQEGIILRRAFAEYPLQQSWSLARNFAVQLARFGLSDVYAGHILDTGGPNPKVSIDMKKARGLLDGLEYVHIAVVTISLIYLLWFLLAQRERAHRKADVAMIWFVLLGLLTNAAIFGGLSAPVDRYQGRVVWLLTFTALMLWARRDEPA